MGGAADPAKVRENVRMGMKWPLEPTLANLTAAFCFLCTHARPRIRGQTLHPALDPPRNTPANLNTTNSSLAPKLSLASRGRFTAKSNSPVRSLQRFSFACRSQAGRHCCGYHSPTRSQLVYSQSPSSLPTAMGDINSSLDFRNPS